MGTTKTNKNQKLLDIDSVSSVFAHDIATPLAIARMNADLIREHMDQLKQGFQSPSNKIPHHIQVAIEKAPKLICENLETIQTALANYKDYLNSLNVTEYLDETDLEVDTSVGTDNLLRKRLQILLVDDEQIHHDIGEAVLGMHHDIAHASSGREAIEQCKNRTFDVILMDLQMPEMSGQETTAYLKKIVPADTQIVGLTSMPIERQRDQLTKSGFSSFLDKPLKPGHLEKFLASANSKLS